MAGLQSPCTDPIRNHTWGVDVLWAQICLMMWDTVGRICLIHFRFSWNTRYTKDSAWLYHTSNHQTAAILAQKHDKYPTTKETWWKDDPSHKFPVVYNMISGQPEWTEFPELATCAFSSVKCSPPPTPQVESWVCIPHEKFVSACHMKRDTSTQFLAELPEQNTLGWRTSFCCTIQLPLANYKQKTCVINFVTPD